MSKSVEYGSQPFQLSTKPAPRILPHTISEFSHAWPAQIKHTLQLIKSPASIDTIIKLIDTLLTAVATAPAIESIKSGL